MFREFVPYLKLLSTISVASLFILPSQCVSVSMVVCTSMLSPCYRNEYMCMRETNQHYNIVGLATRYLSTAPPLTCLDVNMLVGPSWAEYLHNL